MDETKNLRNVGDSQRQATRYQGLRPIKDIYPPFQAGITPLLGASVIG